MIIIVALLLLLIGLFYTQKSNLLDIGEMHGGFK